MKIIKLLISALAVVALQACTTLKDASDARGQGTSQVYSANYDETWNAAVTVVQQSKLDLVSKDKEDGKILAQKSMSAFSYGENVAVFVDVESDSSTKVEVVSKRALAANIVAKNWTSYILTKIKELLE